MINLISLEDLSKMQNQMIAIFLLAIGYVIFGAIWYSPKLFGKYWMECAGIKEDELKGSMGRRSFLGFLNTLVVLYVLSIFIDWTGSGTFGEGIVLGFWAWLGFMATTNISHVIWRGMQLKEFCIHTSYSLIALAISGGILSMTL
jgi:hypothetical protein